MSLTQLQREALRYLRVTGEADAMLQTMLNSCEEQLRAACAPRYIWRLCEISETERGILFSGTSLCLPGQDIRAHLRGCDRAVLLAATLSLGADTLLRRLSSTDMAQAVVADALASAMMEETCDRAQEEIQHRLRPAFMTWRFSPGYGDLPLGLQHAFITVLDADKKIGLTATAGDMLLPQKSVTAVIGLSERRQTQKPHGCAVCNLRETCGMRGACADSTHITEEENQ
ncbi:MAG: hypothetical protein IJY85_02075 [Ruminococcus sp.]|nr:hypothetical protein [Ruminococcus sp.]